MRFAFLISGGIAVLASLIVLARSIPTSVITTSRLPAEPGAEAARCARLPRAPDPDARAHQDLVLRPFAYGYFQASAVLFLPLYPMQQKHVAEEQTILVPAFFAGGMPLFSNVAGRSGRFGHLF